MDNNYPQWTIDSLLAEIKKRQLRNPINEAKFPDPEDCKRRLVSLLEGDDKLLNRHPEILKYGFQVEGYEYTSAQREAK